MKYILFLSFLLLLVACASPDRAGSLYNPKFYQQIDNSQKSSVPINKQGDIVEKYHSALGNLCTHYRSDQGDSLVCNDGQQEQNIRALR